MGIISLAEIIKFVGDFSRPLVEGSLARDNVLTFGVSQETEISIEFFALVMSLTDPKKNPYEVNVEIQKVDNFFKCSCSCTAKEIEHCKHVIGFLLLLERTPREDIEEISKTDLKQSWGHVSERASRQCEPSRLKNMTCHVTEPFSKYPPINISGDLKEDILQELMTIFPQSALTNTYRHRCTEEKEKKESDFQIAGPSSSSDDEFFFPTLPINFIENFINEEPEDFDVVATFIQLNSEQTSTRIKYYNSSAEELIDLCTSTSNQNSEKWKEERRKRITGSICYGFHTYYKNTHSDSDWQRKISSCLHSNFKNANMEYGSSHEPVALALFQKSTSGTVCKAGLIINKHLPCLGYSPDALLIVNNELSLIEVKCPKAGRTESCEAMIAACKKFVTSKSDGGLELRKKCAYYGQVQLGMFLTNTKICHFLIYNDKEKKNVEILVDYDKNFQLELTKNLIHVYFKHYLPYLETYYNMYNCNKSS